MPLMAIVDEACRALKTHENQIPVGIFLPHVQGNISPGGYNPCLSPHPHALPYRGNHCGLAISRYSMRTLVKPRQGDKKQIQRATASQLYPLDYSFIWRKFSGAPVQTHSERAQGLLASLLCRLSCPVQLETRGCWLASRRCARCRVGEESQARWRPRQEG